MVFNKILVPTDGSEYAKAATKDAIELAKLSGGEVTAIFVVDKSMFANLPKDIAMTGIHQTMEKEAQAALATVRELGEQRDIKVKLEIIDGTPANVIIDRSKEFDLIVMGSLGKTGMTRLLVGSVAEKVVRAAECRVMVVKSWVVDKK
ncbi:MAG TPA: universal stress protein [Candidatus Methanomethylophilaceae archaeon]|nr:universal stress protein [Candidatus Methanomethylophilaceae archaeon]